MKKQLLDDAIKAAQDLYSDPRLTLSDALESLEILRDEVMDLITKLDQDIERRQVRAMR